MPESTPPRRPVLMVSYYFPPLGGIGSLRALKFAQYLPEFGWVPTVLAPSNGSYYRDPSLTFPEDRVCRSFSLELSRTAKRLVQPASADTRALEVGHFTRRIRDWVRGHVYRPDGQIGWYPGALLSGRRLLRERRFDAIFSSSFPVTAHLVARRLARENALPWVAEFRDPFAEALAPGDGYTAAAHRLEAQLLGEAAAVVSPSPDWARSALTRGAQRVSVITNGCDPKDLIAVRRPPHFVLGHLGTFMPERQDLDAPFAALAAFRGERRDRTVSLRIVGDPQLAVLTAAGRAGLAQAVEVTGFLAHQDALRALCACSALLLVGPRIGDPVLRGWIPAKLFEYLGTNLPIVYVGHLESRAARILESQPGCFVAAPEDRPAALSAIRQAASCGEVTRRLDGMTRRDLARQLAALFDAVVDCQA